MKPASDPPAAVMPTIAISCGMAVESRSSAAPNLGSNMVMMTVTYSVSTAMTTRTIL